MNRKDQSDELKALEKFNLNPDETVFLSKL
jgi:hypothetical protein